MEEVHQEALDKVSDREEQWQYLFELIFDHIYM